MGMPHADWRGALEGKRSKWPKRSKGSKFKVTGGAEPRSDTADSTDRQTSRSRASASSRPDRAPTRAGHHRGSAKVSAKRQPDYPSAHLEISSQNAEHLPVGDDPSPTH